MLTRKSSRGVYFQLFSEWESGVFLRCLRKYWATGVWTGTVRFLWQKVKMPREGGWGGGGDREGTTQWCKAIGRNSRRSVGPVIEPIIDGGSWPPAVSNRWNASRESGWPSRTASYRVSTVLSSRRGVTLCQRLRHPVENRFLSRCFINSPLIRELFLHRSAFTSRNLNLEARHRRLACPSTACGTFSPVELLWITTVPWDFRAHSFLDLRGLIVPRAFLRAWESGNPIFFFNNFGGAVAIASLVLNGSGCKVQGRIERYIFCPRKMRRRKNTTAYKKYREDGGIIYRVKKNRV